MKDKIISILLTMLLAIGLLIVAALLIGFPVMLIWNWLMPVLFGLQTISFLQAFALYVLMQFLFTRPSTK